MGGKPFLKRQIKAAVRDTENLAVKKVDKFGAKAVSEAKARLCAECTHSRIIEVAIHCAYHLTPINLDGTDCLYYKAKGGGL